MVPLRHPLNFPPTDLISSPKAIAEFALNVFVVYFIFEKPSPPPLSTPPRIIPEVQHLGSDQYGGGESTAPRSRHLRSDPHVIALAEIVLPSPWVHRAGGTHSTVII